MSLRGTRKKRKDPPSDKWFILAGSGFGALGVSLTESWLAVVVVAVLVSIAWHFYDRAKKQNGL